MLSFLAANWWWLFFLAAMLFMHAGHGGRGGGCGGGHGGHSGQSDRPVSSGHDHDHAAASVRHDPDHPVQLRKPPVA